MKIFINALAAMAMMAVCAVEVPAAPPLTKASADGVDLKSIPQVKPRGSSASVSNPFLFPKWGQRSGNALRRDVKQVPPLKVNHKAYSSDVEIPKLFGWVNYSSNWYDFHYDSGVYYIPRNNSESYSLRFLNPNKINSGVVKDGIYYCCYTLTASYGDYSFTFVYYEGYDLATVDPQNASRVRYYYSITPTATSMTLDDSTGYIYGIAKDNDTSGQYLARFEFGEVENEYNVTKINNLPGLWSTIVSDRSGQLYGIKYYTVPGGDKGYDVVTKSELYQIDKNTAEVTLIGDTGVIPQFDSDAVIDLNSGRMFWVVCPETETSYIAEVDLTTGHATPLYTLPDDAIIKGLAIDAPVAYDKAPAAVSNASVNFEGGSLSGTATFTTPNSYFDGTPATSGNLTAKVLANGTSIATKEVTFNQNVSMDISVPQAGLYNFDITVENSEGISPKASIENVFVGNGTPKAPIPTLSYTDGVMNLSWQAVTESADGGYINPAEVSYTVTRFPDNVVVADNITDTSFSESISTPAEVTTYYYTVTANHAGLSSAAGESNTVLLGAQTPPFYADFNSSLNSFTIVNDNEETFTWQQQEAWVSGLSGHGNYMRINTYMDTATDDWLLTPPLYLEAGNAYKLRFFVVTSTQNDEVLEIKMGESRETSNLTTVILEPTTMRYGQGGEIECSIPISSTGVYTIGFHAISPANSFYIAIDNVSISEPYSYEVPKPVSDFKAEAAEMGALSAIVSLVAPTQSINGTPLKSLESIKIYRDDNSVPVHTFSSPQYGATLSFTDMVDTEGTYSYTAIATNSYGESDAVSTSVFIGTGIPKAPENVRFSRTNKFGEVVLTWDAVTENTMNQSIDPNNVTYNIYTTDGYHATELTMNVSGTSYTYQAVPEGEQAFMQYVVEPVTAAGQGQPTASNVDAVGKPYESIHESGQLDCIWKTSGTGALWVRTNPNELGLAAQDGDNLVYALAGESIGDGGTLTSGLVSLSNMTKPGITFYIYSMGEDDTNELKLSVIDAATGTSTQVASIVGNTLPELHRWNKVMIPLDAYAGQTISICFEGTLNKYSWLLIDNISVDNLLDYDLGVDNLRAPSYATVGTIFPVVATIRNEGMKEVSGYTVQILSGSDVVASCNGNPIASNTPEEYSFEVEMPLFTTEPMNLVATVVYNQDQNPANNTGSPVSVAPAKSHLPAPLNLTATWDNNTVLLTWTEPDYTDGVATQFTESFETAESWAHEFGDWQFIDVDESPVGGIVGFTTPGIDYSISTSSFYIFDTDHEDADDSFSTHSGSKMLASLFRWDNQQVDDWAISPLLDGTAQTISFYACSYDPQYPETIEVYYTTYNADVFSQDDYVKCATFANLPGNYTECTAELPDGATRFAIRSCAQGAYLLLLDDVTFYPDFPRTAVELLGYEVYRDGVKLNDMLITEPIFTDGNVASDADYRYVVVALYNMGVSAPSNDVGIDYSGLTDMTTDNITVTAGRNIITVKGAENQAVAIYSVDGRTVYADVAPGLLNVTVPQGVYLVKTPTSVTKVVVR